MFMEGGGHTASMLLLILGYRLWCRLALLYFVLDCGTSYHWSEMICVKLMRNKTVRDQYENKPMINDGTK